MKRLNDNARVVFDFIVANKGNDITAATIAEATGLEVKRVNGILTGLQKQSKKHPPLIVRVPAEIETEDGETKGVKLIQLTDEADSFDPDEAYEEE